MAGSFNKIILVGRLTRDPETKYTPQGTQLCKFSLAVDRQISKNGDTDFFNIVAWQKLAEICEQYLKKGKLVLIEGEAQTRQYETQDGQKRTAFEIVARTMQMLGSKNEGGNADAAPKQQKNETSIQDVDETDVDEFDAEDMPF